MKPLLPLLALLPIVATQPTVGFANANPKNQVKQDEASRAPVAKVGNVIGTAYILRRGDKVRLIKGFKLFATDQVVTSQNSALEIVFADGSNTVITENSSLSVEDYRNLLTGDKLTIKSVLNLVRGKARFFFKPREGGTDATVKTKNAVLGIRGTLFMVDGEEPKQTKLVVLSGQVKVVNPSKPEKEIVVKPNQMTTISKEEEPEEPVVAPPAVVAQLTKAVDVVPNKAPDGEAPKDLELPPPEAPAPEDNIPSSSPSSAKGEEQETSMFCTSRECIPVPKKFRPPVCEQSNIDKFERYAQELDPLTLVLARELVTCPGLESEILFWTSFYHTARGEVGQAAEVGKLLPRLPATATERDTILHKANRGDVTELKAKIFAKESGYINDAESILVYARTLVRARQFKDARNAYAAYFKIPKLISDTSGPQVELAYVSLLEGHYEVAEKQFRNLLGDKLSSSSYDAAKRGHHMASERQFSRWSEKNKSESSGLELFIRNEGKYFSNTRAGLTAETRYFDGFARIYQLSAKNSTEANKTEKGRAASVGIAREHRFPWGLGGKAMLGYYSGGSGSFLYDAAIDLNYASGWRPFLGLSSLPVADSRAVEASFLHKSESTIYIGFDYESYFTYRFNYKTLEQNSFSSHAALARIPLLGSLPEGVDLRLRGFANVGSHKVYTASYFSPLKQTEFGGGLEAQFPVLLWLKLKGLGEFGFVKQDNPSQLTAGDIFADLYKVKSGTSLNFQGGLLFPVSQRLNSELLGGMKKVDNENGEQASRTLTIQGSLRYSL